LHEIITKPISNTRKEAAEDYDIKEWFELLQACMKEYDIGEGEIWNFDETGFQVGMLKGAKVMVPREIKQAYIRSPENREMITCIECISAKGECIPSFIIVKGKNLMGRWFRDWESQGHHPKTAWTYTASGFTDTEKTRLFLDHFLENAQVPQRRRRTNRPHVLLLMDGHSSHTTQDFITGCWEHGIIPFALPPHTTHILQPLDVCVFQPYKHWQAIVTERIVREGVYDFGKDDFLRAQPEIKKLAFKKSTIKSAFRHTGIWPFDPNHVL
jgi:DDE superfamily endonuclease